MCIGCGFKKNTDKAKKVAENVPFCPKNKTSPMSEYTEYMRNKKNLNIFIQQQS